MKCPRACLPCVCKGPLSPAPGAMFCDDCSSGACTDPADWTTDRDGCIRALGIRNGVTKKMDKSPHVEQPQEQLSSSPDRPNAQKQKAAKSEYVLHPGWTFQDETAVDLPDVQVVDAPAQDRMETRPADDEKNAEEESEEEVAACCILHGPRIDEETILKNGQWCCYCCCMGVGWLKDTHSPCHCLVKCICIQHVCEMVEHETREGLCGAMQTCCFCTPMFQLPPPEGVPRCMLCDTMFGKIKRTEASKQKDVQLEDDPVTKFEHVVFEHHQPCFCVCTGCGFQPFFQNFYDAYFKCCCCRYSAQVMPPCEPDGGISCCRLLINAGLCVSQCRLPFRYSGNPMLACCGMRFKKHIHIAGQFA